MDQLELTKRLKLHSLLKSILGTDYVYFQPPANVKISYPCIIYKRLKDDIIHANNTPYNYKRRYSIMIIDEDPDTEIPDKIIQLPTCEFSTSYISDNLNHYVYSLYF